MRRGGGVPEQQGSMGHVSPCLGAGATSLLGGGGGQGEGRSPPDATELKHL